MLVSKQIGIYWELLNLKWYFQVPKKFQPPLQYLELWRTVPGTGEFDWVSPRSMSNSPHYLRSLFRTSRSRGHLKVGDHALHCFQLLFWNNKYGVELKSFLIITTIPKSCFKTTSDILHRAGVLAPHWLNLLFISSVINASVILYRARAMKAISHHISLIWCCNINTV